ERLHPEAVVRALCDEGRNAVLLKDANTIIDTIAPELRAGDVVAILSNGGFDGIYDKLPQRLRQMSAISRS
ncbi:MAG: UDP-N-acetylmuramate:L-alanyl-gamma-D-glutamyl-meso-diaminopimelate ligase, partial [Silvibacterium sp.]|nr:UDP-N-acetylmuramate:L-alanyl-gamma-D-glutamyl-meso-diaminopimelate ligase [Silvibacterium sp.]